MDYFYDSQIRRFIIQFAKMFSWVRVTRGKDANGNDVLIRIPVQYGNSSRMVAAIQANNSASSLPSAPMITYYISGLEYDQRRTQEPYFIDKMQVRQRKYNTTTGTYETTQGQAFTIERPMPVPYTLRMTLDLWTTNENQKLQFIEQTGTLFNPSWEIQSTDNYIDWTSLSVVYQDGMTYSSRSVPSGTNNPIDIFTWKFYLPIWLSQPVKLKKMGVINKVIASIHSGSALDDMQDDDLLLGTRQRITPYGYKLMLLSGAEVDGKISATLQVYPNNTPFNPPNSDYSLPTPEDTKILWSAFLNMYGAIRPGISQIWLQNPYMETEIVGTIVIDPLDDRILLYSIDKDTLPLDTLDDVNAVVNPMLSGPSFGLEASAVGQRYLLVENIGNDSSRVTIPGNLLGGTTPLNDLRFVITDVSITNGAILDIGQYDGISAGIPGEYIVNIPGATIAAQIRFTLDSDISYNTAIVSALINSGGNGFTASPTPAPYAWGNLVANANDIIQCVAVDSSGNGAWIVVWDSRISAETDGIEYVTNLTTGVQYRWADGVWRKSYEGWYDEGSYSIVI